MSLTYVTAFLKLYETERGLEKRLENARHLLNSNIPLVVFISPCYLAAVQAICGGRDQLAFFPLELADTETYKVLEPFRDRVPEHRNHEKDTFEFLVLMNAKAELVSRIVQTNPFGTSQFAWADFCLFHIFQNPLVSQRRLELLCYSTLSVEHSLIISGCLPPHPSINPNTVHWRFCGGFFMGTAAAIQRFYEFHKEYQTTAFGRATWEVNLWAFLEQKGCPISWYKADHTDAMIDVPRTMFEVAPEEPVLWLTKKATALGSYDYPPLPGYQPTSSSFLEFQDQQFLNVRYVNYTQTPEGMYIINDPRSHLKTENRLFILENYDTVKQSNPLKVVTDLPVIGESIQGLEDVRLYTTNGQLKFIATQQQYSVTRQSRMAIGSVDVSESLLTNLAILEPPHPTHCEKNWIPIHQDLFIYQWYPFQIGKVTEGRLEIVQTMATPPSFQKVRGSTTFHEVEEGRIGLVHWSEERHPRHYYHMLVLLDKETLNPVKRSDPFVFGRIGIEFCIGMAVRGSEFQFWYSQHDRDPVWLVVPRSTLPMRPI